MNKQQRQEGNKTKNYIKHKLEIPAASRIQAAIRRKQPQQQFIAQQNIANEIMSDAVKAGDIRDQAAKALQGAIKRKQSQKQLKNIYEAKEQIAGRAKALLTTKATFGKIPRRKESRIDICSKYKTSR